MKSKSAFRLVRAGSPAACTLAAAIVALLATHAASAATITWDIASGDGAVITDGTGIWSDAAGNWNNGSDMTWSNSNPDDAIFGGTAGGTLGAAGTVTLGTAITAGSLTFNTPFGGGTYIIDTSTFGLQLNTGITANESATIQSSGVGGSILLGGGNAWSVASGKTLTVSSSISGSGYGLTKNGLGILTLTNTNTYTGQTTVTLGTLNASATDALGTGAALLVNGGTLALGGNNNTVAAVTLSSGSITGTGGILTGTSFGVESGSASANLAGTGAALTKTTGGTVTLSGTNTYDGGTTVSAGTLLTTAAAALPGYGTPGSVVINGGTLGVQVGGSGWTTAQVDTLLANATKTSGALGIDTTNGNLNQWTAFTTTNLGALGLTKLGSNTLTINNAASTYTGKTSVVAGTLTLATNVYLTNIGAPGPLGAPTGADATIDFYNGTTLTLGSTSPRQNQSTNRSLNLAGTGTGTVSIKVNDNDTNFAFGGVTATGTGPKTLALYTGASGNGDRESLTFNGAITDVTGDSSALSLQTTFTTQSGSTSFVNLNGGGTFTGPITLIKGANVTAGYLTIGGTLITAGGANYNAAPGSTMLGGGSYAGNISLDTATNLAFASSANQTLSGLISGNGGLLKLGNGVLTTSNNNSYVGATTISGGLLRVNGVNTGASATTVNQGNQGGALGGTGTLPGTVTVATGGAINLVDGAPGTLTLNGATTSLTLSGTAAAPNSLYFDLGNATVNDLIVTGAAHSAATASGVLVYLNQLPSTTGSGTYTLIQGGAASTFTGYTLGTTRSGHNLYSALGASGNNLQVTVAAGDAGPADLFSYWKGNTAVWNTAQWYSDAGATTTAASPGYNSNVMFTTSTSPTTLTSTLGQDYEINSLTALDAGLAALAINTGNMLTIDATSANGNTSGNGITVNNTAGTTIATKVGLGNSQTWTVGTGASLTVSGVISDFGAARSITKTGAGALNLAAINTFSGGLTVKQGTVNLNTVGTATTSAMSGGGIITLDPTLGDVSLFFNVNGTGGQIANPINVTSASGGTVKLGTGTNSGNGGNNFVFSGPITLNGTALHVQTLGGNSASAGLTLSGGITGTGNVYIDGTTSGDPQAYTFSNFALNNAGTVTVNASQTAAGKQAGTAVTISALIGPNVTGLTQNSGSDPSLAYNVFNYPLVLSGPNTFNGPVSVLKGELRFNSIKNVNAGLPNALGQPSLANSTITLGSGTNAVQLTYNGSTGDSTDRVIDLAGTTGRVAIDNSTSGGTLKFTSALTASGAGSKILTLQGSTAFGGEMAGAIVDNSGTNKTTLFKAGTGVWTLSGANSYSGNTTVIGGSLIVSSTGTLGLDTSGNNVAVLPGANIGLGSASSLGLSQALSIYSNAGALGGIGVSATTALPAFTNSTGTYGGVYGIDYTGSNGITSLATLDSTLNANAGGGTGHWFLGSASTGTFDGTTLAAASDNIYRLGGGGGSLTLNQTNVLTGGNAVQIGAILSNGTAAQQSISTSPTTVINGGGTVVISAPQDYSGATVINGGTLSLTSTLSGGGAISTAGAGILNESAAGVIGGASSVTINSSGTSILAGANTYSGDTTVNFGTLSLTGTINSSSALKVGGGTFSFAKTGTNTQIVNGLTVNPGNSTVNSTVAGDTLKLAAITRAAGNGTVNFGTVTGPVTTTTANVNGIIGPWATTLATTNLKYAVANGDASGITGLTGTAAATAANLTDTTGLVNYDLALATGTIGAANFSGNTIRYTGAANTLAPGGTSFTVNGLMNASGGTWTIGTNPITIGANKELVITTNTQAITISSAVQDNGGGASGLTFSSVAAAASAGGVLTLSGNNLYTGPTTVNSGTLKFTGTTGKLSTSSAITLNGASVLLFDGATRTQGTDFASGISGTGVVRVNSVMTLVLSGTNTYSGGTIIGNGNNDCRVLFNQADSLGTGPITFTNTTDYLGSTIATPLTLSNRIIFTGQDKNAFFGKQGSGSADVGDLTFTDTVSLNNGAANGQIVNVSDSTNVTFSGPVIGSGLYINKSGTGTLTLSGANTYTGQTRISGGTLSINSIQDIMSTTPNSLGLPGTNTIATNVNTSFDTASTIALFTTGTLKYTGSSAGSSNRVVNLASAAGGSFALDASGSTPFALSGGITTAGTSGTSTLTLTGTGAGSESGSIINGTGSNVTALTKTGGGTWTLSGTNSYSGLTDVQVGTLLVNGSNTGAGAVTVGTSGTLGGTGAITGAVSVTGQLSPGASVGTLGIGGGLTINAGGILNWENNTINTLGSAGTNWDVVNVSGGSTTISNVASTGSKLKLLFTNALTSFSNSFWDVSRTWNIITGGLSAGNFFDTSNISIYINSVLQNAGSNAITGEGAFTTAVAGSNLELIWTPTVSLTPYQQWAKTNITDIQPLADATPGGDADNDGIKNVNEFAFATDPLSGSSGPGAIAYAGAAVTAHGQPILVTGNTAVFGRRLTAVADGLTYTLEFSADLVNWATSATSPTQIATDATIEAVSVAYPGTITTPGGGTQVPRFFRVLVTLAP